MVVRGGGDLGSGVAVRLRRCGFRVVVLESPRPVAVRRTVAFAEAVYEGNWWVEGIEGRLVGTPADALAHAKRGVVPVLVDPEATSVQALRPAVLVDAIMAKKNVGSSSGMARIVVGLGPGFEAGCDVDAVVETNRGPHLGRVIWRGSAEPNTGTPGLVSGAAAERVLRAPRAGQIELVSNIGAIVEGGQPVAWVAGELVAAPFHGLVRGLIRDRMEVTAGMKIGDLDPRLEPALCALVSDKALAIAGGVLEAILSADPML